MGLSTKNSIIGKVIDFIGINNSFHKYEPINFDSSTKIISPVEAKVANVGNINSRGEIISKSNRIVSLRDIIGEQSSYFFGGSYVNFYLNPLNKHFWVTPCDGRFVYTQKNEGKSWLPIFIGLENLLGIEVFDKAVKSNASIGSIFQTSTSNIAMIAVGSLNVNRIHVDYEENKDYERGVPCGYFSLGSSILLCFPNHEKFLVKEGDSVQMGGGIIK